MSSEEIEFEQIYADFRPKIHRFLIRMVGEYEAEDLTQEVFVRVNQALPTFRGESKLSTWIYRIATNAALDRLRSPSFQRMVQSYPTNPAAANSEPEIDFPNEGKGEKEAMVEQQV